MASNNPSASYKLFKTVIDDTINNVKDKFLDEGVDEQILLELKQIWETKLLQSRAVDTGVPQQTHHVQPYHDMQAATQERQQQQQRSKAQTSKAQRQQQQQQQQQQQLQQQQQQRQQQQAAAKQASAYEATASNAAVSTPQLTSALTPQAAAATLALPQGVLQLQPHQLAQLPAGLTLPAGINVGGQQFPAYQVQGGGSNLSGFQIVHQPISVQQQQQQQHTIATQQGQIQPGQVITFTTQGGGLTAGTVQAQGNVLQVDGGNDTSDEEDEYDNDDDDDNDDDADDKEDGPNDVEEEPLNSDDDVSDEDPAELFDTDNVVVCQYDRINRNRNKWKFTLKSGIMNLKGKDLVFFKATGEAEW